MGNNYLKHKEWLNTPKGRASSLLNAYNQKDKKQGRGKGNLTSSWIVENILYKPCTYCGKTGWKIIGCNRIDNDKPHTIDNVEPCCKECNDKLHTNDLEIPIYQYALDGELIGVYKSATYAAEVNGFNQGNIHSCCTGKRKTHKGYIWSFKPL